MMIQNNLPLLISLPISSSENKAPNNIDMYT